LNRKEVVAMGSKKEEWKFEPGESKGEKVTTTTKDDGSQRIVTQNAEKGFFSNHAYDTTSVEKVSPSKNK